MKKTKRIIIICSILVVIVIAIFLIVKFTSPAEIQFRTIQVSESKVEISVTATGYVQPVDKIEVGTQVSGVIEKIYVDFNSNVKKGQLLAELDKLTLLEKVNQAEASLESSESDLLYAQQNYDRVKSLYDVKAATESSLEDAINRLAQAKSNVINANATLHQAKVNLSYAEIYSPIDGIVLERAVEQGQTVASSFNTPTLFTIANDLTKMQVEANVDEADIGKVQLGQNVTFTVDAYSDLTFTGTVKQIRLQPIVTSNVVTYTVIVEAPNPDEKLFPGMTANITIIADGANGMSIPVAATYFIPSDEVMKHLRLSTEKSTSGGKSKTQTVWVKQGQTMVKKEIHGGLSNGVTMIVNSGLNNGDEVVLSATIGKKEKNTQSAGNPLMPSRPRR